MFALAFRMLKEVDKRLLFNFIFRFGLNNIRSIRRFEKQIKTGNCVPPFFYISVTNACNLSCQGCWVHQTNPPVHMDPDLLRKIIREGRELGNRFYGILGGEPFLYPKLLEILSEFPDCYFQIMTNGTQITEEIAEQMRWIGNVTPIISIEGLEQESDRRRGGSDVFNRSLKGLKNCRKSRLITGLAASICKTNIGELASDDYLRTAICHGAHYIWYYIYRPSGACPAPELALNEEQILKLRRFIVESRSEYPIAVVDAYWDHKGRALCPAATGISCHINPFGDIEPCPPVQFSRERITTDGPHVKELFENSDFLKTFRDDISAKTRGCILLEDPSFMANLAKQCNACDSGGRNQGLQELSELPMLPCHHIPGKEIPEKNIWYKIAKKNWFFGFGAYG